MSLRSPAPSISVAATLGSLDNKDGLRSVSRSTSSSRAVRRSALAGYIYMLGQAILTMDTFSTYTGFELRQQILANAVIVALLTESVR
jgi:hypothetical protein